MNEKQLVFVYNANSDLFSTVSGFVHKILSPSTYDCHLCTITYGNFSVNQEWKSYIETLPVKTRFFHKDEFAKEFTLETALPAIFIQTDKAIKEIISRSALEGCQSLDELKKLVTQKLEGYDQHHHPNI